MTKASRYPDISDILAQKASGRARRGALSFAEKLDVLDALKERVAPLVKARIIRQSRQVQSEPAKGERVESDRARPKSAS